MRAIIAEIHVENLRHNYRTIRDLASPAGMLPMVKANAYGHGIVECTRIFQQEGAAKVGVAYIHEVITLRRAGITMPALCFTPPEHDDPLLYPTFNAEAVVWSADTVRRLSDAAMKLGSTVKVHLSVDTGMNRDGVTPNDALTVLKECYHLPGVQWEGIFTHFATADGDDDEYALWQLEQFNRVYREIHAAGYRFRFVHAANSGAIIHLHNANFDLVRPGIALYGYKPSPLIHEEIDLRPVMSLKTKIVSFRRLPANASVSYGRRYTTPNETTIVTIPVGYGDGWSRLLTGKAECLIHGKRFPIVGTICMDGCMVDVGDEPVQTGEEVVLIGQQGNEIITAQEIAEKIGTIPYEITSSVTARVERVYISPEQGY